MHIAIDASVLVAIINPNDLWHTQAKTLINRLDEVEFTPVNFDCAVTEAVSVLVRRLHEKGYGDEVPQMLEQFGAFIPPEPDHLNFP